MDQFLQQKGVRLSQDWLGQWHQHAQSSDPSFLRKIASAKQEVLWQEVLLGDLHVIGVRALPADLQAWHKRQLQGLFVLQADEVTNIAAAAKHRYSEAADKRCLRLTLTDGAMQVTGLEYHHIRELHALMPAGIKIAVKDVTVRRGTLLLTPDNTVILGGQVDALEKAKQQALKRWNQPATGRSSRHETGPVDLYAEASAAAWREESEPSSAATAAAASASQPNAAARPAAIPRILQQHQAAPRIASSTAFPAAQQANPSNLGSAHHQPLFPRPAPPITPPSQVQQQQIAACSGPQHNLGSASSSEHPDLHQAGGRATGAPAVLQPNMRNSNFEAMDTQLYQAAISPLAGPTSNGGSVNDQSPLPSSRQGLQADQPPRTSRLRLSRPLGSESLSQQPGNPLPTPLPPPRPLSVLPTAAAQPSTSQSRQELIVIDDSPQLPRAQPQQPCTDGTDEVMADADDDDDDDAEALPSRTQRRPVLQSSPDSEQDNNAAEADAMLEPDADLDNVEVDTGSGSFDPASNAAYRSGIVPDTLLDPGLLPEEPDDYSAMYANEPANEPEYDDQLEEPEYHDEQQADEDDHGNAHDAEVHTSHHVSPWSSHQPEHHPNGQQLDMEHRTEPDNGHQDMTGTPANPFQISSSPDEAAAGGVGSYGNRLADMQGLFAAPHTNLKLIQQLLPSVPAAELPMTLRINGKMAKTLGKLEFRDADNQPLDEYSIRVQLEDATSSCAAIVGHEILLGATEFGKMHAGVTPAQFTEEYAVKGKAAVMPYLQGMNNAMANYFKAYSLMEVVLHSNVAEPVIVSLHDTWTEADKAALGMS